MTDPKDFPPDFTDLRRRAEERLQSEAVPAEQLTPAEAARLIHELRVNQIELEMQNDELRLSQARLEESRSKYADLYDFAPVGYLTLDEGGKIVEANLTAATLLGMERSRLIGGFFTHFLVESDRLVFRQVLNNGLTQRARRGEFHLKNGNGDVRTMLLDILSIQDAEGRERRRVAMTDISELKRTKEELRIHKGDLEELVAVRTAELVQANEQLREVNEVLSTQVQILTSMAEGVTVTDHRGNILYANPAFDAMFGYKPGELVGRPSNILNYYPPEENTRLVKAILESVNATGAWFGEFHNRKKDGEPFFTSARISAIEVNDKRLFISVQEDITERKRAEEMLYRQAELLDLAHDAILVRDLPGRITFWNRGATELYGWTPEEALGQISHDLLKTEFAVSLADIEAQMLEQGYWLGEVRQTTKNGRQLVISSRWTLRRDEQGRPQSVLVINTDITEQKQAEQALRERTERYELVVAGAHAAIWDWDVLNNRVFFSPRWKSLHGYAEDEDIHRLEDWSKCLHPEDAPRVLAAVEEHFEGKTLVFAEEYRILSKNGSIKWVFDRGIAQRDASGRVVRMAGSESDITERKAAEQALRESEERLRLAQQVARIGTFEWDMQTGINTWTPELEAMYGLPPGGFARTQSAWEDLVHPEDRDSALQLVERALETGLPMEGEWRVVWPDGSVHWLAGRWQVFKDESGLPLRMTGVNIDITERKIAEQALRESEARERARASELQTILDAVPTPIFLCHDPNGRYITGNPAAYELLRLPPGTNVSKAGSEDEQPNYQAIKDGQELTLQELPVQRAISGQIVRGFEYDLVLEDGTVRHVSANAAPLVDEAGQIRGAVAAFMDLTERHAAEQALRESREDLNRAQAVAHTGSWRLNVQKNELTWSDENHRIFGIPPGTPMTYETFLSTVHPEDLEYVDREWKAALNGEPYDIEHRLLVDGQVKWVRERAELEFDQEGRLLGGFGTTQDITRRKEAEQEIRRLANFPFLNPNPVLELDETGRVLFANPAACQVVEKLNLPEGVGAFIPSDLKEKFTAVRQGGPRQYNFDLLLKDTVHAVVLSFPHDLPTVRLYALDITERKKMEEALKEAQARTAAILDSISDSFFALDQDMVVTYYNRAAEKVLGRKAEEVLGKKLFDAFPEARGSIFEHKYAEALRTGKAMAFEAYFDVPPFENWYDVRVYPFGQGLSVYFQVSTERKKAVEMLRRAHDELEMRVEERTQELQQAYEHLMREMEEHQETANRLRESEARFTAFMQHLPGPAVMRDVQGRYLFANESWERITGLKRHSWEGKTIEDIWPQELAQKFKPLDYEILSTGEAVEHVEELDLPDGRHYFLAHRFPVLDEDGLPYMVGAVAIDVTARQQAEAALASERQRLFAVLETIPAYVALLAADYTVPFANQEFVRRFGKAEEGQRCYEFLFGRTEPCPDCVTFKVFESNQPLQWEWLGPDGRTYAVYDYPFTDTDGSPFILEMGVDITDRQQAEAALKKNEAMLRLILDTLPVGVWVTDKDGQIIQSNPAARKIWEGARYVGVEDYGEYKGWWADTGQLIAPEEWALARAVQKGETSLGEIIDIQCFDGSRKTIINSAEPLFGDNREILGAIVVNEDITAMREAEKVMREQARQVEVFFEHSITPFVFLDRDFNFLRVNQAYARGCQREVQEFIGHNHFEFYPHQENEAIFQRVVESKTPHVAMAKPFGFPDHPEWGVTYWDWTLVPILDDAGEVDFLAFSLKDVTERKQAELEAERQAAVVAGINRIFREALTCETPEDLGRTCLAVAEELSGSRFGFIDVLNEEGTLDFLAVSDPGWKACRQAGKKSLKLPTHLPVRGIYRAVIEEGTPLIANEPASHPDWRGLPKGHPALTSYLGIPLRNGREVIGQMGVGNREGGYSQRELETLEALGIPIVEAILHKQAKDSLQESEENLHILTGQLLEVQETERRRMSRELHDELGQSLLLLKFKLSSINAGLPRARRQVREECQEALQYLDNLVNEVRRLSRDLSPSPLEELGLTSALRHLLNEFRKHYKIDAHSITIDEVDGLFAPMVEINIYRIFQEILTNVGKHAEATQISVTVKKHDNRVSFAVRDNGQGFTVSEALAKQPGERGIGLASIQERLRMLGGTLVIQSREGAGTLITFTVPLTGSE